MQKKIILWTRNYSPTNEGVSKEILMLKKSFQNIVQFDLSEKVLLNWTDNTFSINKYLFPINYLFLKFFEMRAGISHIFCSLDEFPFIRFLGKKPIVLTSAEGISNLARNKNLFSKIKLLIVESEKQKFRIGKVFPIEKIKVIYPGLDLDKFSYTKNESNKKRILFLSTPFWNNQYKARGLSIILKLAKLNPDIEFIIPIRKKIKLIKELDKLKNILIVEGKINIHETFADVDITIAPFIGEINNKPCPNSIIESLASGKPVLISKDVGISEIIEKEGCGVVSGLNVKEFNSSLKRLFENYDSCQKRCRPTAEKYFSNDQFLSKYKKIYSEVS